VNPCPDNYDTYLNGEVCDQCHTTCKTCSSSTQYGCKTCTTDSFVIAVDGQCMATCPEG
jgi:hypothetical protein